MHAGDLQRRLLLLFCTTQLMQSLTTSHLNDWLALCICWVVQIPLHYPYYLVTGRPLSMPEN